jgi:monoamine oxidase
VESLVQGPGGKLDVRLGHKVTGIDLKTANRIVITTSNKGTFTAKRVVVALPLGVLKQGGLQWQPPLPSTNQQALDKLSMGLLNKLVLVFPRVFWPRDLEVFNRVAPQNTPGAWSETYNMLSHTGKPVLVAFNAAQYAAHLEQKTAAQVKDEYMAVLKKLFGANNVPEPISYTVTAWGQDPYAFGSYSFTKSAPGGAFGAAHRNTAAPIGNRVFFAGEHTRPDCPATAHGALLSGRKAATDLLASLK